MSNIFSGKETAKGGSIDEDRLGGGGVPETDIYLTTIKAVYTGKSASDGSKATSINLLLDNKGSEQRFRIWVTNRKGEVTYKDKKGNINNLPGYSQISALCLLVAGKDLGNMDFESKTLKIYDVEAKKEIPKSVDCLVELHDEEIFVAVQKQKVDETEKNDKGDYVPNGKTRDTAEVVKFFASDNRVTISEVKQFVEGLGGNMEDVITNGDVGTAISKMTEEHGIYADKWLKQNKGKVWDRSSGTKDSSEGKSFNKSSESTSEKADSAKKNLFG